MKLMESLDVDVLKWALAFVDGPDAGKARQWTAQERIACDAVTSQDKLSELLEAMLRTNGIARDTSFGTDMPGGPIVIRIWNDVERDGVPQESLLMPQAREKLVQLLNGGGQ